MPFLQQGPLLRLEVSVAQALLTPAESFSSMVACSNPPCPPASCSLMAPGPFIFGGGGGILGLDPGKTTHEKLFNNLPLVLSCSLTAYLESYVISPALRVSGIITTTFWMTKLRPQSGTSFMGR